MDFVGVRGVYADKIATAARSNCHTLPLSATGTALKSTTNLYAVDIPFNQCICTENSEQIVTKNQSTLSDNTEHVNPALHCFVNMFYAQAFKQLFEYAENRPDGVLPIPVHVLCDDFATGSRVLNFPEYISIFREKGISVTLLLQSESQLEQMYRYLYGICY